MILKLQITSRSDPLHILSTVCHDFLEILDERRLLQCFNKITIEANNKKYIKISKSVMYLGYRNYIM